MRCDADVGADVVCALLCMSTVDVLVCLYGRVNIARASLDSGPVV